MGKEGILKRITRKIWPSGALLELKLTLSMSWALVITQTAELILQPITVMFGGHLGKVELDAIGLSNMIINVFGVAVICGVVTSCETVFSQAYGNGQTKMIGVYLQRAIPIHICALLVCYAIHINLESFLLALAQDPEVSRLSGQYLLYFMPGMFAIAVTMVTRRYTQCQGRVMPHLLFMLGGHVVNAVCQYLFLYQFNMGVMGSVLGLDITYIVIAIATIIFTLLSKEHKQAWGGWDPQALQAWGPLARLGVYGLLMTCFEWWAFEITTLVAGMLGVTQQAAQTIIININNIFYGIPHGVGVATCIRVGHYVGANDPVQAKLASHIGILITAVMSIVIATLCAATQYEMPKMFTNDSDVIAWAVAMMPSFSLYLLSAGINILGRGVYRGVGLQLRGALLSFIAYYLLSWPIALPLVFLTSEQVVGLWIGVAVASSIAGVVYIVNIYTMDWKQLCEQNKNPNYEGETEVKVIGHLDSESLVSEKSSLLPLSSSVSYSMSQSLTMAATKELHPPKYSTFPNDARPSLTTGLIVKRVLTISIFLLFFVAAVILRVLTDQWKLEYNISIPSQTTGIFTTSDLIKPTTLLSMDLSTMSDLHHNLTGRY